MDTIDKLTEIFKEFPGIGERQARRFVYFLIFKNKDYIKNFSKLMEELKNEVAQCDGCYRFFLSSKRKSNLCEICANPNINEEILMVLEKDSDLESVRKSRVYDGKYFILGGLVPIVEKNTKRQVRINELIRKINYESKGGKLKEVVLAFSLSPEGNHTDFYIRQEIKDLCEKSNIKVSSLGRGLSTGTELEYSDNDTLRFALKNRQ